MAWTQANTERFATLRLKALDNTLSPDEQAELEQLQASFDADAAQQIAPAFAQFAAERAEMQQSIETVSEENARLETLLDEQQNLIADAKRWIVEFETRHQAIHAQYDSLKQTGALPAA